ncbi:UDP-N-acetylglucosamine 4,6-dehydratase (inverting) [Candidatus Uhrbacteria bacterium RIFCSPHIGHO2_02_FULL_53_13]|uniref:UDP-N-acetylglucosamine 4,6-dehydratase (Inverting) n=2 Tax=Candidatus Uhriibacteriota TaxID=1752732 RepID=A0A1F7TXA9_9BACT|nr:MAG: UDP-N-acetylglucosamine 4,6-dehydratase (inverting) [Candidatus Uhrbacteria bacterium RIFCSPHIGHO2_02_FULL_53_13]OGL89741.1 MAG: UDP-N-acetylglucosamine 4,6-dehydratase (inverting) [Candidatus Uhrbacteria bacterium RIFCSPLOWO2_02_FULL_53_10]
MLNEKTILITGGTGSLGKQLTRTILAKYQPKKLIIFSRDEVKQFEMAQEWNEKTHPCMRYFLGDVRDKERLIHAFQGVDYVIHAAALKQVPAAEYNPAEFVRTNIIGAMNVIDAALSTDVRRVVALSTDKACNPVNLYGATKLCSDKLFVAANGIYHAQDKRFAVVRYGNVAGSRGSVIPFFRKQIAHGALSITDRRMTRFLITLNQAASFVLQSIERTLGGEIFIPKIPSIRIVDLAMAMAPDCEHTCVGIRPGEKIHELMIGRDDSRNTLALEDRYVLLPQRYFEERRHAHNGAQLCVPDFEYHSGTNPRFLTVEEIRSLLPEIEGEHTTLPIENRLVRERVTI